MKLTKRLTALAVVILMLAASCIIVSAATFSFVKTGGFTVTTDVEYKKYTITSGENGNYVDAVSLEFDPADGYIPMVFSGYSGTSGVLSTQYNIATQKYGYDVVGVINGAFFSMDSGSTTYGNYGTLVGMVISNGKIASAHAGYSDSVVAFGSDGSMNICQSKLDYKLYIKGEEINNGLYYINKTSGSKVASNWKNGFYYYDGSCGSKADTFEVCPGYEVYCKKTDSTDLIVGGTLKGEVIEVRENAYGGSLADNAMDMSDKFILFVKAGSTNASYVSGLTAGDSINITVNETVAESKEIMENANSVISNVGWLVKDGVDRTQIDSTIGTHSVTLQARWTAFGTKADGSYVFFTTEGASTGSNGSVTLRDVAKAMIEMGCTNVIRMDGGGSSAMFLCDAGSGDPGYVQTSTRAVGDCILVVKRSSVQDTDLSDELNTVITEAEASAAGSPNAALEATIAEAKEVAASETSISGDVRRMILKLRSAMSGKSELTDLVALASGISFTDYSEFVLDNLRNAYEKAVEVLGSEEATFEEVVAAKDELQKWYDLSGDVSVLLTEGIGYTASKPTRGDGWDDDGIRLTDGSKGNADGGTKLYAGWDTRSTGTGNVEVVIDLGAVVDNIDTFKAYLASCVSWGIAQPTKVVFSVSEDGTTYRSLGDITERNITNSDATWVNHEFSLKLEHGVSGRYVKIAMYAPSFVWVDEVEAYASCAKISEGIYVTDFNKSVYSDSSVIFTPANGEITVVSANLNWSRNILLKWDDTEKAYLITRTWQGNGTTATMTLADDEILIAVHGWTSAGEANKALAGKAVVGQKLVLHGIDVDGAKLGLAPYITFEDLAVDFIPGDVNGDGAVNSTDYIMCKRAVLGTFTLNDLQKLCADINADGKVNATDYIMLKRVVLGTYVIK